MLRSERNAYRVAAMVDPAWIGDPVLSDVATVAKKYALEYRKPPTKFVIRSEAGADVLKSDSFKRAMSVDLSDESWVMENFGVWCRTEAAKASVLQCAEMVRDGKTDGILDNLRKALAVGTESVRGMRRSDIDSRVEDYLVGDDYTRHVPTGWSHVDKIMRGGLGPGELGVIMGPTGTGKSHALLNLGLNAASLVGRKSVLHVTLELSAQKLMARYDKRMVGPNASSLWGNPNEFIRVLRRRQKLLASPNNDIIVAYWPTRSCSVSGLRVYMDDLGSEGFTPDLVIVDYGDIMKPERRTEEMRHAQAGIFEDLRGLAGEIQCPLWTATQTNRASVSKKVVRLDDVAEAFEKCQIADAVFTLCMTPEEKAANRMRLFCAKLRDAEDNRTITAEFDWSRSMLRTDGFVDEVDVGDSDSKSAAMVEKAIRNNKSQASKSSGQWKTAVRNGEPR